MESRAKFAGHPVHQMLIVFPLGLFATAVVFDLIYLAGGGPTMEVVSYWMIAAGIIGGIIAAPFGWIDWLAIPPRTRAKSIGLWHGAGNVLVLLLFIGSWIVRHNQPDSPAVLAFVFSFVSVPLALLTAWLGGELVDRLGIGVDDGANVNAPNSLSNRRLSASSSRP